MLKPFKSLPPQDRIIVALDCESNEALATAALLANKASWVKVGMTLYYACGPSIVGSLKDLGFKVFLDLKFHDIPHQVRGAAYSATMSGADMMTMHTCGGIDMMIAAKDGAEDAAYGHGFDVPVLLGITVLTSINESMLSDLGIANTMENQVKLLASTASTAGIDGVVSSPQEAKMLRGILGEDAYIVTPGVRPHGSSDDDQSRVATPAEAFSNGSSHIVVGRPITQAEDPVRAFEEIASSLVNLP
ncbi:MAG: orotidine-5'-phosphate decarboxylase [Eggerthellaceae bacterium]|jgi:orotidine-5'-phosphate decarboxylase